LPFPPTRPKLQRDKNTRLIAAEAVQVIACEDQCGVMILHILVGIQLAWPPSVAIGVNARDGSLLWHFAKVTSRVANISPTVSAENMFFALPDTTRVAFWSGRLDQGGGPRIVCVGSLRKCRIPFISRRMMRTWRSHLRKSFHTRPR
jgi:hypothetical protein